MEEIVLEKIQNNYKSHSKEEFLKRKGNMRCFQVVLQCSHEEWQTVLVAHGGLMAWLADAPPSHSLSSIDQEKKKK